MTGHADGVITLDLREVDDVHRVEMREQLAEPYRTVLGHFRHEIGHYFEPILMEGHEDEVRALFGDEREDYQAALDRHYADGPPADWAEHHVSAYATMHPFEDWAETWAHYLHIRDLMQTAAAWGLTDADPRLPIAELVDRWIELSYALNAINRSLGHGDLYPYVLTPAGDRQARAHRRAGQRSLRRARTASSSSAPRSTPPSVTSTSPTHGSPSVSPARNWSAVRSTSSPDGSRFQAWCSPGRWLPWTGAIRMSPPSSDWTTNALTPHCPREDHSGVHSSGSSEVARLQLARMAAASVSRSVTKT